MRVPHRKRPNKPPTTIKLGEPVPSGGVKYYDDGPEQYSALRAIDPTTGKVQWEHRFRGYPSNIRLDLSGGAMSTASGLVFTGDQGGPIRHNLFYARHFKPAVRAAGLPERLRFHDLRHTCAALLIAQGAHPRAMMERLGHSSVQVTIDRYGHLLPSLDETLVDGLDNTYRASVGGGAPQVGVAA